MKKTKTKKNGILALWLSLCILGQAQTSGIWMMPDITADTSIIREWQAKYALIYSSSRHDGEWIHLMKYGSTAVSSAKIDDHIRDIEILNDTAYYCGNDANGIPVVGFFSLPELFGGTLNIKKLYYRVPTNHHLKRLEVFTVQDGIHIVLVGDLVTASNDEFRILSDISHQYASGTWNLYYYIAANQIEFFDDIAVTDNYVVTSAHKYQGGMIYMRMFEKPTNAAVGTSNSSIFHGSPSSTIQNNIYAYSFCDYNIIYGINVSPVWVTATTGDSIAITCMAQNSRTSEYGFTLKIMEVTPYSSNWFVGNDIFVPQGLSLNPDWAVRDLRYSQMTNSLLLLHDIDNSLTSSVESMVTIVDNSVPSTMFGYFNYSDKQTHSIDKFPLKPIQYTSSGMLPQGANLLWELNDFCTPVCFEKIMHKPVIGICKMTPFPQPVTPHIDTLNAVVCPIQISEYKIVNNCK